MNSIFGLAAAYLFGSIPFGLLVGFWIKGIDIRQHGSGNIGTTNVFRVVGKKWGLGVFFLDALKGYLGVLAACRLAGQSPGSAYSLAAAAIAIAGHAFPVWLSFKGGKGVATSLGVFLAAASFPTWIAFGIWLIVFAITHIVSISSLIAAVIFPLAVLYHVAAMGGQPLLILVSVLLAAFIFYTHRANIQRLRRGEEKKLF